MNIFIPLSKEKRANKEECRKEIVLAEAKIEAILKEHEVNCAICDHPLGKRFRSAIRFDKETSEVNIHPVHLDCVKDNVNVMDMMMNNSRFYDFSSLDLLLISGIIDHLTKLEKEGKLPDIHEQDYLQPDMPTPDTLGEPFYTMVEIKDGVLTGNIESHIHEGEKMLMLYVSKKVAMQAKQARNKKGWENYHVAGINKETMQKLFSSGIKFMVVAGFEGSKAIAVAMSGEEIIEAMKPGEWLYKVIESQKESGVVAKTITQGDDCLLSLGIIENSFISLPLFYVQYPNEDILKNKLENQIPFSLIAEQVKPEDVTGTTLEGIHTLKGDALYTNFLYVHNAQMVIEKTNDGVIIRADFIPSEKPEGGFTIPFAIAGIIDYQQEVDDFKNLFEKVGVALIRFDAAERAGDHLYLICDKCLFVNL
jgi:hypothetical protein